MNGEYLLDWFCEYGSVDLKRECMRIECGNIIGMYFGIFDKVIVNNRKF